MIFQNEFQTILNSIPPAQIISGIVSFFLGLIFIVELRKYLKYHSYPDLMELSGIGVMATTLFAFTGDLLLSGLAGILALMIIGVFEVRENSIWVRMMAAFTISYGFFFVMVLLGFLTTRIIPSLGDAIKNFLISLGWDGPNVNQFFVGIGYNLIIYVLIVTAFVLFGRKFIIVTRFISPQMVYLVLYLVALLIILQLGLPDLTKYFAIFSVNILIYLVSGPLLAFLFGIKPLEDERAIKIIEEVQTKIKTPIRKVGIVNAPILNAFAFGPWFDQRIAYITTDLNQFTDAEIRGITAHELAHVKRKHTLLLLGITAIELIIKALIDAPSTYWEYVATNPTWDFLSFWLFNIMLFSLLLTFVKMLEGQADKITKEKGFGLDLAESLYRLEGFYYGIAGEIGFNTQLMTGKTRSKDENIRFMGDQAYYLYRNLAPSRMTCFMNLIASHPLTTIRIAMQIDHSIGAIKAGLMVWFLLIPGLRGRTIRKLQKNHRKMAELLSEKYSRDFGTIDDYMEITYEKNWVKYHFGRYVLAKPWLSEGVAYWGKITDYRITNNIVSPIELELETLKNVKAAISKSDYSIVLAEPQHTYFSKKGDVVVLEDVEIEKGKFKRFNFRQNGKKVTSRSIGLDVSDFKRKEYWLVYKEGIIQPWTLKEVKMAEKFSTTSFIFEDQNQNAVQFTGKELAITLPPLVQMIRSKNWSIEKSFFNLLKETNEPFILYDKEDFDIGTPSKVISLTDNSVEFLEGRSSRNLSSNKIDALVLDYPFFLINLKKEMGFGNILSLKLFNRGLKTKYIGLQ
ncbi:MAG: M48 family metalloprotease [Candidatus Hodarchaeota archaeon]